VKDEARNAVIDAYASAASEVMTFPLELDGGQISLPREMHLDYRTHHREMTEHPPNDMQ